MSLPVGRTAPPVDSRYAREGAAPSDGAAWINRRLRGRIPELDGVRGAGISAVVVFHYFVQSTHLPSTWPGQTTAFALLRLLGVGMDGFFVLSGFLIGGILMDAKGSTNYFRTFYLRRVHRILPIYLILLAMFYAGVIAVSSHGPGYLHRLFNSVLPLWSYPLFLQNVFAATREHWGAEWMSATWSLAVEEQFYLLLPLVIWLLPRKWFVSLTVAVVICAPLFRLALVLRGHPVYAPSTLLPSRADSLGIGVLIAAACRDRRTWEWLVAKRSLVRASCIGLAIWLVVFVANTPARFAAVLSYSSFATFFATLIILLLIQPGRALRAVFANRVLTGLGTYSYAIYLAHYPLFGLCHYLVFRGVPSVHDLPSLLVTLLALAVTLAVSALSWKLLERPLIRRAHREYVYSNDAVASSAAAMKAHA